ncbi:MAG: hypothetical protein PHD46_03005 [Eubacteriales bacterium]|nr:hypothetical protein [Eubacteriales bacterium]
MVVVRVEELVPEFFPSEAALRRKLDRELKKPNGIRRAQRGGGVGVKLLINYDTLPSYIREALKEEVEEIKESFIKVDPVAVAFYMSAEEKVGIKIDTNRQIEYSNTAAILNMFKERHDACMADRHARTGKRLTKAEFFAKCKEALPDINKKWKNSLPLHPRHIERVYNEYFTPGPEGGYAALISKKYKNQNTRKISGYIEDVILSIYAMKNKPFGTTVLDLYKKFISGEIEIVDYHTGEMMEREKCFDKDGDPIIFSEATVWNYLNKPENKPVLYNLRNDSLYYNKTQRPHHHRTPPVFSLSKISMDDRDLTRKTTDGRRVVAYYAYDVASGAVIGASYSYDKNLDLVKECFRDIFRYLDRNNIKMPLEVEVEHHLMNNIEDELNDMFKYVRFCAPGNSQEKRAEHKNRAKKYSAEKDLGQTTGRWWARSEAYLQPSRREGADYVEERLTYNELVAEDLAAIKRYNASKHSLYPGKTREQVLMQNQNPDALDINKSVLYKIIGNKTETSIRRNQYCKVQYNAYSLSHPSVVSRLAPNNYDVDAYWLEDENGDINNIYIYQDDNYIDTCAKIVKYNEATAEQTDEDRAALTEQAKYVAQFDAWVKEGKQKKIKRVKIIETEKLNRSISLTPVIAKQNNPAPDEDFENDLEPVYANTKDYWIEKAKNSL